MDGVQLSKGYQATLRRQFTFYHSVPKISWYSFNQLWEDERLSQFWGHPVVLNLGPLDWESSALTTRPLLHICNIGIYADITHYPKCDQASKSVRKWLADFNVGKIPLASFDLSNKTGAIYVKMVLFLNHLLSSWG